MTYNEHEIIEAARTREALINEAVEIIFEQANDNENFTRGDLDEAIEDTPTLICQDFISHDDFINKYVEKNIDLQSVEQEGSTLKQSLQIAIKDNLRQGIRDNADIKSLARKLFTEELQNSEQNKM